MAVGVGGLLMDIMNPQAKIGQALAGPSPNPQPMPGGAPSPQDGSGAIPAGATANAPPSTPPQAPPQTYAPDPTNAKTINQLLSLYQNEARANDLNRNIATMGSAFGTAQQQHDKLAAIQGMPQGGSAALGAISDIQGIQKQQLANEEASRFAAGSQTLLQTLGYSKDQAATIGSNPTLTQQLVEHDFLNKSPTEAKKNWDAARAAIMQAHPETTPQQLDQQVPPTLLTLGISGATPSDQEYYQYAALERAAGRAPLGPVEWNEQQKNKAIAQETQTKSATEFKDTGIQDFDAVHAKLTQSEDEVNKLLGNMSATMSALKYPSLLTTSGLAAGLPDWKVGGYGLPDEATKQAAVAAQQLIANLTGESLREVKNLRNQREFGTLGTAATAGLNANNGIEGVKNALLAIKQKFAASHANAYAVAGKQIPNQYAGLADPRYTSKTLDGRDNPYYTGATYEPSDSQSGGEGGGGQKIKNYNPKTGEFE